MAAYLLENDEEQTAVDYFERALKIDFSTYKDLFEHSPNARFSEPINKMLTKYQSINIIKE